MSFRTSLGQKAVLLGVYLGCAAVAEAFFTTPARIGLGWIGSWRTVWNAADGAQRVGRQRTGKLIRNLRSKKRLPPHTFRGPNGMCVIVTPPFCSRLNRL
jgi:hypothetical protein